MKKFFLFAAAAAATIMLASCGSTKQVVYGDVDNVEYAPEGRTRRSVDPTYTLAKNEGAYLRAAQSATSFLEDVALENAEAAAAQALASRIETAIYGVRERFNKNNQLNAKIHTEQAVKNYIKSTVSQVISYKVIGEPSIYDNPDNSITAYVCVELITDTETLLNKTYDTLTQDEMLSTEFERTKFVEENKEELKKLQGKVGL